MSGGAETAAPKWPSLILFTLPLLPREDFPPLCITSARYLEINCIKTDWRLITTLDIFKSIPAKPIGDKKITLPG